MKYARLSIDDLKDFEKEFIEFLVINGITADEWEHLKSEENQKAEEVINQFSDVVWEGVLRKVEMVELRKKNAITICKIHRKEVLTLFIKTTDSKLDFRIDEQFKTELEKMPSSLLSIRRDSLPQDVSSYLFSLIQSGFLITQNEEYKQLFDKHFELNEE